MPEQVSSLLSRLQVNPPNSRGVSFGPWLFWQVRCLRPVFSSCLCRTSSIAEWALCARKRPGDASGLGSADCYPRRGFMPGVVSSTVPGNLARYAHRVATARASSSTRRNLSSRSRAAFPDCSSSDSTTSKISFAGASWSCSGRAAALLKGFLEKVRHLRSSSEAVVV
jgi:hypothetical protein